MRRASAAAVFGAACVVAGVGSAGAAPAPCAPLGSWATPAKVTALRTLARRSLPAAAWRALEAGGYHTCFATRAETGRLVVWSFKLPIKPVGQRIRFRLLYETGSHKAAVQLGRQARANFAAVFGGLLAHPKVLAVEIIDRFLIVTVTAVHTRAF